VTVAKRLSRVGSLRCRRVSELALTVALTQSPTDTTAPRGSSPSTRTPFGTWQKQRTFGRETFSAVDWNRRTPV